MIQDARGNYTTFVYDDAGRLSALVDQLGQRTSYSYAAGQQTVRTDAKGQITSYVYDDADRQTNIQYSDGKLVTFAYDANGNRTRMEDSTGLTTYTYDELNRPKTVTYPANKTITYTYDAVGNRATMTDPDGGITTYSYDSRNLLSTLLNPFAETTTWVYDVLGRVTTMTHANGTVAEHDYDAGGNLTALRNLKSDRSVLSIFSYSYDNVGNRNGVAEANGDLVTWSYDNSYQLTREQRSGSNAYDVTYTYDSVGNRLTKLEGGVTTTYTCDVANELLTSEDSSGVTTFSYDANGNTLTQTTPALAITTYTWDIENHQTKVELPSSVINTITLDGDGKRRTIEDSAGLKKLIWDAENILAETNSGNSTVAQYNFEPEEHGMLVSQRRSGATSFHHFDALGSTNKLTDSSVNSLAEYLFRAFGIQTILSGSSLNHFTWVGQLGYYSDQDATNYWVRMAIVSPLLGRRLERDPHAANGLSMFAWVGNNPITAIDPSGLLEKKPCKCCGKLISFKTSVKQYTTPQLWGHKFTITIETQNVKAKEGDKIGRCSLKWSEKTSLPVAANIPKDKWYNAHDYFGNPFGVDPGADFDNAQPTACPSKPTTFTFEDPPALGRTPGRTATRKLCIRVVVTDGCTSNNTVKTFNQKLVVVKGKLTTRKPPGAAKDKDLISYCKYP